MYWYYKLILTLLVVSIIGGSLYLFRDSLPFDRLGELVSSDQGQSQGDTSPDDGTPNDTGPSQTETVKKNDVELVIERPMSSSHKKLLQEAAAALSVENYDKAIMTSRKVLMDPSVVMFSKVWNDASALISQANTILATTSAPSKFKHMHQVQPNDSLSRISRKRTTVRTLQRCNNIAPDSHIIRPGQKLFFFEGPWKIEVYKSQFTLVLYQKGEFFKSYKIGIGVQNRTPETGFTIYGKVENPDWAPPGKPVIPFGDPRNVLGTRWMKLETDDVSYQGRGFGIHGTIEPDSVGTPSSQGCIRMRNEEVEELYDFLPDGGVVEVNIKE